MTKQGKVSLAILAAVLSATVLAAGLTIQRGRGRGAAGPAAPGERRGSSGGAAAQSVAAPPLAAADNPGVRSVAEARATRAHPERLSPLVPPLSFDRDAFEADPQAYLDVVEPGRCFQTGRPSGPDSVYLEPAGSLSPPANPGETVPLAVTAAPGAPVTFTVFGQGHFTENLLNSVSVRADARGYAVAHFVVPIGVTGRVPVLVGSPLAIGNQTFMVEVARTVAAK